MQRLVAFFRARGTTDVQELEVVQEDVRFMLPKVDPPGDGRRLRVDRARPAHAGRLRPASRLARPSGTCCALAGPRAALLEALRDVDRLVLLGDLLELRHGPARDALSAAAPALEADRGGAPGRCRGRDRAGQPRPPPARAVARAALSRRRRRRRSGWSPPSTGEPGEPLAAVAGWFSGAEVSAAYPGVWLRDDVYATHGHYCDRHTTVPMFERLGAGAMAKIVREPPAGPVAPEDYEAILAPIYAWIARHRRSAAAPTSAPSSHGASAQAWRALAGRRRGDRAAAPGAGAPPFRSSSPR